MAMVGIRYQHGSSAAGWLDDVGKIQPQLQAYSKQLSKWEQ